MYDSQETVVLCGANSYEQKYYFNQDFSGLPEQIRQELQIMCVLFTEDVGGILTLEFLEDGTLILNVDHEESDYLFDEIGSELKIREIQREKVELMTALERYFRIVFLGEDEIRAGVAAVKDLRTGEQVKLPSVEAVAHIQSGLEQLNRGTPIRDWER